MKLLTELKKRKASKVADSQSTITSNKLVNLVISLKYFVCQMYKHASLNSGITKSKNLKLVDAKNLA